MSDLFFGEKLMSVEEYQESISEYPEIFPDYKDFKSSRTTFTLGGQDNNDYPTNIDNTSLETYGGICLPPDGGGRGVEALRHLDIYYVPENLDLPRLLSTIPKTDIDWNQPRYIQSLYFVVSYLMCKYAVEPEKAGYFINISSELLVQRFGKSPKVKGKSRRLKDEGIEILKNLGVILHNPSYCKTRFTMSYRLTDEFCESEYKKISFKMERKSSSNTVSISGERGADSEDDVVKAYILKNLRKLSIDEQRLAKILSGPEVSKWRRLDIERNADLIRSGRLKVGSGRKQRRIYHVLTSCPKELRAALVLDGEELIEADITSCQPVLLLSLCQGVAIEEIERYKEILNIGIYTALGGENRAAAKVQFLLFAFTDYSDGKFEAKNRRLPFAQRFILSFPAIAKKIETFEGTLASYLQDLEAEICLYTVIPQLEELGIFAVSIHDAYLIRASDYLRVKQLIQSEFERRFDFTPGVKSTPTSKNLQSRFTLGRSASLKSISRLSGIPCKELRGIFAEMAA